MKFPFSIFATAEASEFKFGMQFGFFKAHHKITPKEQSGRKPGLGELPKIWGFLLIFLQRLEVATSRLAGRWALLRSIIKSHPEEKLAWPSAKNFPNIGNSPLIFLQRLKVAT